MFEDAIDDKVIDRIKKLLALAENNTNEHEAKIAMERAHRLLARYNLSIKDLPQDKLDKSDPYVRMDERYGAMKGPVAARVIAAAVAKLYFCKMFYVHYTNRGDEFSFVGRQTNVETARTICRMIITALAAEARLKKHIPGYATNFMIGASNRISSRVYELIEQAKAGTLKEEAAEAATGSSTAGDASAPVNGAPSAPTANLPALRATYEAEAQRTEEFLTNHLKIRFSKRGGSSSRGGKGSGHEGYSAGQQAGSRIPLRPGVTGSSHRASAITNSKE